MSKKERCDYPGCKKVIEGFSSKHVEWLMLQHQLKHRWEERKKELDKEEKKEMRKNAV